MCERHIDILYTVHVLFVSQAVFLFVFFYILAAHGGNKTAKALIEYADLQKNWSALLHFNSTFKKKTAVIPFGGSFPSLA